MPIYPFHCGVCGDDLEVRQSFWAKAPECCDSQMERLIAPPAVIRVIDESGNRIYSKGYKEGYAKEHMESIET